MLPHWRSGGLGPWQDSDRRRWLRDVLRQHRANRGALERQPAGERVERHDAQRIDVAAVIRAFAARLLGAHVVRGAENLADAGDASVLDDACDPEVYDQGAARGTPLLHAPRPR